MATELVTNIVKEHFNNKANAQDEVLECRFRNLSFSPSTKKTIDNLLNFFFTFIDI